jgi:PHD/YefM family antitoxin component YafN of YafNO toxin-antitoxin module
MSADCFQTLDVTRFRRALADLHELVGCSKGRVEVTRRGCDDVCVLISKAELESLERALQIFAESAEFRQMSSQIAEIVAAAGGPVAAEDGGGAHRH